jgi:hypothetical protein
MPTYIGSIYINLDTPASAFDHYVVRYRKVGGLNGLYSMLSPNPAGTVTTIEIPGADLSATYEGTIQGACVVGGVTSYTPTTSFTVTPPITT